MSYYIRGAATVAALVLPLILLYKLLRRNTSNDETNNNGNSTTTTPQNSIDSTISTDQSDDFTDSSPSDSPQLLPSVEYEVFLSFRGPDTRHQITDILFRALVRLKIHTFRDDDELRTGEEIWSSLVDAIGRSKIYVPIFSKSYAHSKWCLDELVEIVETRKQDKRRVILPVFYMVDPRDVRHQTGPYENAFREHEKKKKVDRNTIQKWRAALTTVAALKGWHVKDNAEQGKYADMVSDSIWSYLRRSHYAVGTGELVAIDGHVEEVVKRLSLDSNDMTMVGLHGIGGIGKTTLAKAVFNKILTRFDRCSFVENIRETQQQNDGILKIQKKLIADAMRKEEYVVDVTQGRRIIADRVSQFKIFIVLDDIDEKFKFEEIFGNPQQSFASGSRFIVTSRNRRILSTLNEGRCKLYEVEALSPTHSLQLFSKHAFKKDSPPPDYETLSIDIVSTTGGLPLTLEVVGSLLYREEKSIWEAKLKQLREVPERDVIERLKISYDALEYEAKEIFLDIACFYIGKKKEKPFYMWNDCNFNPTININLLIQRSMVKIEDGFRFRMHDQLRDMGRDIVRRENIEYPWLRSRIWTDETARELLYEKKGTEQVKAIKVTSMVWEHLELKSEFFVNLSRLRYFKAPHVKLSGDFNNLLPNLKWLTMRHHESLEGRGDLINFHMKHLVILDLHGNQVTNDWGGWTQLKMANKLKVLNLSSCALMNLPELPESGSLEVLDISFFNSHQATWDDELDIGKLRNLLVLRLAFSCIRKITGGTSVGAVMKGLRELDVEGCECENLSQVLADVEELQSLQILRTGAANRRQGTHQQVLTGKLPTPSNLKELTTSSPIVVDLSELTKLEKLVVEYSEYGLEIPIPTATVTGGGGHQDDDGDSDADSNNYNKVWWKISKLKSLRLYAASRMWCSSSSNTDPDDDNYCCRLPSALTELHIRFCSELEWVPNLENLQNLTELFIESCPMPREIRGLCGLKSLQTLRIHNVVNLLHLDGLMINNDHLQQQQQQQRASSPLADLVLEYCTALERLPSCSELRELHTLRVIECPLLTEIPSLGDLLSSANKLQELIIQDCPRLAALSLTATATTTKQLNDDDDDPSSSVATSTESSSLQRLVITGCTSLLQEGRSVQMPHLSNFPRLKILYLTDMRINTSNGKQQQQQQQPEGLECLEELVQLRLGNLQPPIERLPSLSNLGKLRSLEIIGAPSLREIEGFSSLKSLAILQLTDCTSLERLDLSTLEDLEVLQINGCPKLEMRFPSLSNLGKLRSLEITDMPSLQEIEGLANLKSLQTLDLSRCTSLEKLPRLEQLSQLAMIKLEGCTNLTDLSDLISNLPAGVAIYQ